MWPPEDGGVPHYRSRKMPRGPRGGVALLLAGLFIATLGVTTWLVWPDRTPLQMDTAASDLPAEPTPVPAIPAATTPAPTQRVALVPDAPAGIPVDQAALDQERLAAAYAEPALIDLLEDAESDDPQVREEARRLLREQELLAD